MELDTQGKSLDKINNPIHRNSFFSIKRTIVTILLIVLSGGLLTLHVVQKAEHQDSKELEQVTVQLKWLHQAQFAGHYVADKKGFYNDVGISTTLIPFDYVNYPIDEVLKGNAEFGVTGAEELFFARAEGKPVKAIAVVYQESPVVTYTLEESGITQPGDFIGKRVGVQQGGNVEFQVQALLESVGVDYDKDVTVVPIEFDPAPLIEKTVDVSSGYAVNEPIAVESKGYPVKVISPSEYGVHLYGDILFTTEEMIQNNPDLVQRFVSATLKGWEYALQNKEEAVTYILSYDDPNNTSLNYKHQLKMLQVSESLIKPSHSLKVGQMNFLRWKKTYDYMRRYDVLQQDINVKDVYTTIFLN